MKHEISYSRARLVAVVGAWCALVGAVYVLIKPPYGFLTAATLFAAGGPAIVGLFRLRMIFDDQTVLVETALGQRTWWLDRIVDWTRAPGPSPRIIHIGGVRDGGIYPVVLWSALLDSTAQVNLAELRRLAISKRRRNWHYESQTWIHSRGGVLSLLAVSVALVAGLAWGNRAIAGLAALCWLSTIIVLRLPCGLEITPGEVRFRRLRRTRTYAVDPRGQVTVLSSLKDARVRRRRDGARRLGCAGPNTVIVGATNAPLAIRCRDAHRVAQVLTSGS